jgi:hypothetical protein
MDRFFPHFLYAKRFVSFQVVDLQAFLLPRITLKPLVPSFPCFANIFVSLMEKVGDCSVFYRPPRAYTHKRKSWLCLPTWICSIRQNNYYSGCPLSAVSMFEHILTPKEYFLVGIIVDRNHLPDDRKPHP